MLESSSPARPSCNQLDDLCRLHFKYFEKGMLHTAQYPIHWTTQSDTLHPLTYLFIVAPKKLKHYIFYPAANIRDHYSLAFPPPSLSRYSFIQLTELGLRVENENAQYGPINRCRQRTTLSKNSNPVIVLHRGHSVSDQPMVCESPLRFR